MNQMRLNLRDKESIEKIAGAAAGNSSLFGGLRLSSN
jgi:hypothetical protein